MCLKLRACDGVLTLLRCECGSNDFSPFDPVLFPDGFVVTCTTLLRCRNCGKNALAGSFMPAVYPTLAEKAIAP
jgi:hypothetical protein